MKTTLADIAQIQTGIFAKTDRKGQIVYLQAKHFDETGSLTADLHPDLKGNNILDRHLLRPGDVLFCAKGSKNFAAVFHENLPPSVASTSFFVIRLREGLFQKIRPDFLAWWFNHPASQKTLKGQARGTSIASISKPALESFGILLPDRPVQDAVLKITELRKRERSIQKRLDELRETQIQQQIFQAINK